MARILNLLTLLFITSFANAISLRKVTMEKIVKMRPSCEKTKHHSMMFGAKSISEIFNIAINLGDISLVEKKDEYIKFSVKINDEGTTSSKEHTLNLPMRPWKYLFNLKYASRVEKVDFDHHLLVGGFSFLEFSTYVGEKVGSKAYGLSSFTITGANTVSVYSTEIVKKCENNFFGRETCTDQEIIKKRAYNMEEKEAILDGFLIESINSLYGKLTKASSNQEQIAMASPHSQENRKNNYKNMISFVKLTGVRKHNLGLLIRQNSGPSAQFDLKGFEFIISSGKYHCSSGSGAEEEFVCFQVIPESQERSYEVNIQYYK